MSNFFIDKMDFDDLVFEHRNKDYGAFPIRKKYNSTILFSIFLASIIVCFSVIYPYIRIYEKNNEAGRQIRFRYVEMKMDKLEPPKEDIYVPPTPAPPPPRGHSATPWRWRA